MIVITGAAGFISSCLLAHLNELGYGDLILVDDFKREDKKANYRGKKYTSLIDRVEFPSWLEDNHRMVQYVFHLGARTDTTLFDIDLFNELNLNYSKRLFRICTEFGLPFLYASSAATYGDGENGFDDQTSPEELTPLNPYGESKNDFDKWVLSQSKFPPQWVGLKFFNVYGPNEYHKGRMASVIFHAFNQIKATGKMKLFRSHMAEYKDGEQLRDFIYVKDVSSVCEYFMLHRDINGIFNLGTGKARTFNALVNSVFNSLDMQPDIDYIDIPLDIRTKYQYFTEADMNKLNSTGCKLEFTSLEVGVKEYVSSYLSKKLYW